MKHVSATAEPLQQVGAARAADATRARRLATLRRAANQWTALIGAFIVVAFCLLAIAAPLITPYDPYATDASVARISSSSEHWLGTDDLGRDYLSRLIYGARWSLGTTVAATVVVVIIGVTVGLTAGYFGGLIDDALMRVVDVLLAFPSLVLALAIVGMLGPSLRNVMIGVVVVWWVEYARVVRGLTLSIKEREYITAAHSVGCSPRHIIFRHVLPNAIPSVIVLATLELGVMMLAISGLSFLGLGVQPPTPEWGAMLNNGRTSFQFAPHLMIYPGIAITLAVIGFNLVGDSLRDALDPHMK